MTNINTSELWLIMLMLLLLLIVIVVAGAGAAVFLSVSTVGATDSFRKITSGDC
jgi:hypothetical protein